MKAIPSLPTVAKNDPSAEKEMLLIEPWQICHLAIGLLCKSKIEGEIRTFHRDLIVLNQISATTRKIALKGEWAKTIVKLLKVQILQVGMQVNRST